MLGIEEGEVYIKEEKEFVEKKGEKKQKLKKRRSYYVQICLGFANTTV